MGVQCVQSPEPLQRESDSLSFVAKQREKTYGKDRTLERVAIFRAKEVWRWRNGQVTMQVHNANVD